MSRTLTTAMSNAVTADVVRPVLLIRMVFDTAPLHVWNGVGDLTFSSNTYSGLGDLISISTIEETSDVSASGINVVLTGLKSSFLSTALNEDYQNRPITVFLGFLSAGSSDVVGTLILFKGRMISLEVVDTPEGARVRIDAENRLLDLRRPSNLRYTKESQNFLFSGDVGLNRVNSLMDKEIIWGRTSTSAGDGGGKSDMNDINDRYPPQRK